MENTIICKEKNENPLYYFEIIKRNNKIRSIINKCKSDNIDDIIESERENVILYLKNRGSIFMNKDSGYLSYKRGNIVLTTDNYDHIYKCYFEIREILNNVYKSEVIKKHFGSNIDKYYCKEHKIHNHDCIESYNVNAYYTIDCFSNYGNNGYVINHIRYLKSRDENYIKGSTYYEFKNKLLNNRIDTFNINKLFFLRSISEDTDDCICIKIIRFLTEDEILDILDYYYINKDFIEFIISHKFMKMSFKEYIKELNII